MSITNNEITQNSKSEPKKFSILCTFKQATELRWKTTASYDYAAGQVVIVYEQSRGVHYAALLRLAPLFPKGFDRSVNAEADAVSENPHPRPPDLRKGKEPYSGRLGKPSSLPSPSALIHTVPYRRKIRLIESNPKCHHKKYLPVKWLCGMCLSATLCKNESNLLLVLITFMWWKNPPKCCSNLVLIVGCWKSLLMSGNSENSLCLSRIFGAQFVVKDRGLSTCKPWSKQAEGWILFCMKRLWTLDSSNIHNKK